MLSDEILQLLQQQQGGEKADNDDEDNSEGDDDGDNDDEPDKEMEDDESAEENDSDDEISLPALPPVERQTFVYSATLTLPSSVSYKKSKKSKAGVDIDGAIAEILEKARSKGKTKVVDLTNCDKSVKGNNATAVGSTKAGDKKVPTRQIRLPPGLELQQIKCTQLHKDSHLYAYLMTTTQGTSGPCLVFCNSIAAVRRVGTTLETLSMPVRILHAQMQQVRLAMSYDGL